MSQKPGYKEALRSEAAIELREREEPQMDANEEELTTDSRKPRIERIRRGQRFRSRKKEYREYENECNCSCRWVEGIESRFSGPFELAPKILGALGDDIDGLM